MAQEIKVATVKNPIRVELEDEYGDKMSVQYTTKKGVLFEFGDKDLYDKYEYENEFLVGSAEDAWQLINVLIRYLQDQK
jgi:hypothetical protein